MTKKLRTAEPGLPPGITPGGKAVRRVADRYKPKMAGVVLAAMKIGRHEVDTEALVRGFEERSTARIEMAINPALARTAEHLNDGLPPLVHTVVVKGAQAEARNWGEDGPIRVAKVSVVFDAANPLAVTWAKNLSSQLIVEISEGTRRAVQEIARRAFDEGLAPVQAAKLIETNLGLHIQYVKATENLRHKMLDEKNWGRSVKAGRTRVAIPKGGPSVALVEKRVSQYSNRLLRHRAVMIARTETVKAANAGQRLMWRQAQSDGLMDLNEQREWLTTPDPCPICEPLAGEKALMDQPYPSGHMEPPAHPGCKCSQAVSKVRSKSSATLPHKGPGLLPPVPTLIQRITPHLIGDEVP